MSDELERRRIVRETLAAVGTGPRSPVNEHRLLDRTDVDVLREAGFHDLADIAEQYVERIERRRERRRRRWAWLRRLLGGSS